MAKKCECGCGYPVFSHKYAKFCQWKRTDEKKPKPLNRSLITKKVSKGINKVSIPQLKLLKEYRPLRDAYMVEHEICEVRGCENPSNNLHHRKGRSGKLLIDTEYFMACCGVCHPRKIHETHVEWAYDNGYLIRRN